LARTVPVSLTEAPGNFNTAALFNAQVKALNDFITNPPSFKGYATVQQSIGSGSTTPIPLALDSEYYDTDGGHSTTTNTSRYVIQVAGKYALSGGCAFGTNGTGNRSVAIYVNGTYAAGGNNQSVAFAGNSWSATVYTEQQLNVGDYVEIACWQTSGGNLSTQITVSFGPWLAARWFSV
jgi:hypothetical protein